MLSIDLNVTFLCVIIIKWREMSRLSHCYHIFGPGLLLNWKVPATGCCNIPAASLRRSIYHRGWDISTLFILLNPFKTIKHSPNAYLRLEMNVCNSHVVVSPLDFFSLFLIAVLLGEVICQESLFDEPTELNGITAHLWTSYPAAFYTGSSFSNSSLVF